MSKAFPCISDQDERGLPERLHMAACRGDTEEVEKLLQAGCDPNSRNHEGATALHGAVRQGHAETAACLLAHGASHALGDADGRTPLSLAFTKLETLHAIRQRFHRLRNMARNATVSPETAARISELETRGMVKLSGWIEPEMLACMKNSIREFVRCLGHRITRGEGFYRHYDEEEHYWHNDRAYVCNNAFKYSAELVRFCCRSPLVEIANGYLGKKAHIQRGVAMRYLPSASTSNDMFGWHHDMEEKRLKAMILLTDVGPEDQTMSYVVGSQRLFHPAVMFVKNPCSLDYCRKHLGEIEIVDTVGQAGDVFLFDSNGAHRGNRRPAARVRDAFFVEYTADPSEIWGGDIPPDALEATTLTDSPLDRFLSVEKKWLRPVTRKGPTWLENLPRVESWLLRPSVEAVPSRPGEAA